jgi:hypothetical protein
MMKATARPLYLWEEPGYPLDKAGECQGLYDLWQKENPLPPLGIESWTA